MARWPCSRTWERCAASSSSKVAHARKSLNRSTHRGQAETSKSPLVDPDTEARINLRLVQRDGGINTGWLAAIIAPIGGGLLLAAGVLVWRISPPPACISHTRSGEEWPRHARRVRSPNVARVDPDRCCGVPGKPSPCFLALFVRKSLRRPRWSVPSPAAGRCWSTSPTASPPAEAFGGPGAVAVGRLHLRRQQRPFSLLPPRAAPAERFGYCRGGRGVLAVRAHGPG